jgi:hypothetical protein
MKPTTGRVQPKSATPPPEPPQRRRTREPRPGAQDEQRSIDVLMTAVWTSLFLFLGVIWFAVFGGVGAVLLDAAAGSWDGAWFAGLVLGLTVGLVVAVLVVRRMEQAIRARSRTAYRGIWVGATLSLVLIGILALPVVVPQYCPPGAICPGQ